MASAAASSSAVRAPGGVFGIMPVRASGLQQPQPADRKRTASVVRDDPVWQCVEITDETDAHSPHWRCLGCGAFRSGGATRIADHLLGRKGSAKCMGTAAEFLAHVDKVHKSETSKEQKKSHKQAITAVNNAASSPGTITSRPQGQPMLSFNMSHIEACDAAIAELFYACNISASVAQHPKFKKMVTTLKAAPVSYKPPDRNKLYGSLLNDTVSRLQRELAPLREAIVRDGATIVSDGWDNVSKDHLINFLYGNASCLLFDGTVELTGDDGESADFIAELLRQCIERNGRFAFVQTVTDTCSVMKAAWKLLQAEYPWLTATCCGTHVLSLELKDLGKLSEVDAIIKKVSLVLSFFWGRTRWPHKKLREVIKVNHGREFGLYRAKVTRFAGKFREMQRLLRVKADLQQVVVSAEYASHKFSSRGRTADEEEGEVLDPGIGPRVKAILLDEDNFWTPLTHILSVAMPILKLLRLLDSNKPVIGKVYDRMFLVGQRLKKMEAAALWATAMSEKHAARWEYLHSPFHAAGYALDPEFLETTGELDAATMEGLMTVLERMCLRDAIMAAANPERAWRELTVASPEVVERVAQVEREFAVYQRRDGVFSRPSVLANAKTMEPAAWWGMYGKYLPLLSVIAPRVLAQPAAASAAERNWSIYGQIQSANRARMAHKTADKLVFCHETMHTQLRMQDAGWSADVERWQSDEESDNSDAEYDGDEEAGSQLSEAVILRLTV